MKKKFIGFWIIMGIFLLCACSSGNGENEVKAETEKPEGQESFQEQPVSPPSNLVEETINELFDYRFVIPERAFPESKSDGVLYDLDHCDLFVYRKNTLEFSAWEDVIEKSKEEVADAIYAGFRFWPKDQTGSAESPTINKQGIEMMRVTGSMTNESDDPIPYIAYYYVTEENYLRFMICLNYENEADAAEVIDYVAERLEKA